MNRCSARPEQKRRVKESNSGRQGPSKQLLLAWCRSRPKRPRVGDVAQGDIGSLVWNDLLAFRVHKSCRRWLGLSSVISWFDCDAEGTDKETSKE
jgi:hypothetical protein